MPKTEIREFLALFVDGFGLGRDHLLTFRPDDRVEDVYHAINPPWIAGDSMELETFAQLLMDRYALALESMWRDGLTLGHIFAQIRAA
ncbi:MAG TPA: hypothetical protein VH518_19540 [Tepidisphaeraceae bacterium]